LGARCAGRTSAGLARAIAQHPRAWLAHRCTSRRHCSAHARDWPAELIYVDAETAFGDNPPIAANTTSLHTALMRAADALRATPALAARPYLLAGWFAAHSHGDDDAMRPVVSRLSH
jgi:hypothetical protein